MPETTLTQLSDHVYWMTPGAPDRPSLAAVVARPWITSTVTHSSSGTRPAMVN